MPSQPRRANNNSLSGADPLVPSNSKPKLRTALLAGLCTMLYAAHHSRQSIFQRNSRSEADGFKRAIRNRRIGAKFFDPNAADGEFLSRESGYHVERIPSDQAW